MAECLLDPKQTSPFSAGGAITMVESFLDLELKGEVQQIVEALEYYCVALRATSSTDASEHARLAEMLKQGPYSEGPTSLRCFRGTSSPRECSAGLSARADASANGRASCVSPAATQ